MRLYCSFHWFDLAYWLLNIIFSSMFLIGDSDKWVFHFSCWLVPTPYSLFIFYILVDIYMTFVHNLIVRQKIFFLYGNKIPWDVTTTVNLLMNVGSNSYLTEPMLWFLFHFFNFVLKKMIFAFGMLFWFPLWLLVPTSTLFSILWW